MAIQGDMILVGAPAYTAYPTGSGIGTVYVYRYEQGAWQETQRIEAPSLQSGTEFGNDIALHGDVAVIGEPNGAQWQGAAYVYRFDGTIWSLEQELLPPVGSLTSRDFGSVVALEGPRLLVSGRRSDPPLIVSGEVDIFEFDGSTWAFEATLTDATLPESFSFGQSLAIDGEWIVVGIPRADDSAGAAQVFHFDGSKWSFRAQADRPERGSWFGYAVALHAQQLIVGAWGQYCGTCPQCWGGCGAVYIHDFSQVAPDCDCDGRSDACEIMYDRQVDCNRNLESDECDIENGTSADCNANAVPDECDLNTSCISDDCNGNDQPDECDVSLGASEDCNTNGLPDECEILLVEEDQRITATNPSYGNYFGSSMALDSRHAVFGTPNMDTAGGYAAGAVHVFRSSDSTWFPQAVLTASDGDFLDFFGTAVAVDRRTILVGAYGDECISTTAKEDDCGSAYVFGLDSSSGQWREEAKLLAVEAPAGSDFGRSVSLGGNLALIGAPAISSESNEPGRAFVFRKIANQWIHEQTLTVSEGNANAGFGSAVAVDGYRAMIGAPYESCTAGPNCGAVYIFRYTNDAWMLEARITDAVQTANSQFGNELSLRGDVAIVATRQQAHIHRFDPVASLWRPEASLWPSDLPLGNFVIRSVGSDVDGFVIGGYRLGCSNSRGAAYSFRFDRRVSSWVEVAKSVPSDAVAAYGFGGSVALHGGVALVGASGEYCASGSWGCGAAYYFSRLMDRDCDSNGAPDECGIAPCTGDPACTDCNGNSLPDRCDIVGGASGDCNSNAIPDECEEPECPPVLGACCDLLSGSCADDLPASTCSGTRQSWTADAFCGDVVCDAVAGACCDLFSGICAEGLPTSACSGTHQAWTERATCADVVCEAVTGACCDLLSGTCADEITSGECSGTQQEWTEGAVCVDVVCDAVTGACCDHDPFGACTDGVTLAACDCPACEWVKLGSCLELDCPHTVIPTVGSWGLAILSLLLMIGAKIAFRRRMPVPFYA